MIFLKNKYLSLAVLMVLFQAQLAWAQINIDSIQKVINQADNDSLRIYSCIKLSAKYPDSGLFFVQQAADISQKNATEFHPVVYFQIAEHFAKFGNNESSTKYYRKAIQSAETEHDHKLLISLRNYFGYFYTTHGKSDSAIMLHIRNLELVDKEPELSKSYSETYIYLAFAYRQYGDLRKALSYFKSAEQSSRLYLDTPFLHIAIHEKGNIYSLLHLPDSALVFQLEAFEIRKKLGQNYYLLTSYNDIAGTYHRLENYPKAAEYYEKSLELTKNGFSYDPYVLYTLYGNLGEIYQIIGNIPKAEYYLSETLENAKANNIKYQLRDSHLRFAYFYYFQKEFDKSAEFAFSAYAYNDSVYAEENSKTIEELSTKYETEKKEQQIIIQNLEIRKKNIQTTYLLVSSAIFFVLLLLIIFAYRQKIKANNLIKLQNFEILEKNEELQQQKEEIEAQRDEITAQNTIVSEQNKHITESITYASKIQRAALPKKAVFEKYLSDYFIFFKPRDIVSGDFYWAEKIDNKLIVAIADCTGHGVPGAFMSMLGISFLGNIVRQQDIQQTNKVLEALRHEIKTTLSQTAHTAEQKDGMDMAFFTIDLDTLELNYSGAYNSLYIIRNLKTAETGASATELTELKADRQPVAVYIKEKPFVSQLFQLQKGDCIYGFSDGFVDQFGGESGGKYKIKKFKLLLETISNLPMSEQQNIISEEFTTWRVRYPQTDDVLVMGLKV